MISSMQRALGRDYIWRLVIQNNAYRGIVQSHSVPATVTCRKRLTCMVKKEGIQLLTGKAFIILSVTINLIASKEIRDFPES